MAQVVFGPHATLGEGPIWWNERLLWVDIVGEQTVNVFDPITQENQAYKCGGYTSTVVPRVVNIKEEAQVVAAVNRGLVSVELSSGKISKLPSADPEPDRPKNRYNDGKCDPAGRLWIGTMDFDASPKCGSLYSIEPDLKPKRKLADLTISNGLDWTVDAQRMFFIDTPTREIWSYSYDTMTGEIANRQVVASLPDGYPDGMTVDTNNHIWVALWGGGAVQCWDAEAGKCIQTIPIPDAQQVTAVAFGGEGMSDLFVTTAAINSTEKNAGNIFRIQGLGVHGKLGNAFEG